MGYKDKGSFNLSMNMHALVTHQKLPTSTEWSCATFFSFSDNETLKHIYLSLLIHKCISQFIVTRVNVTYLLFKVIGLVKFHFVYHNIQKSLKQKQLTDVKGNLYVYQKRIFIFFLFFEILGLHINDLKLLQKEQTNVQCNTKTITLPAP